MPKLPKEFALPEPPKAPKKRGRKRGSFNYSNAKPKPVGQKLRAFKVT